MPRPHDHATDPARLAAARSLLERLDRSRAGTVRAETLAAFAGNLYQRAVGPGRLLLLRGATPEGVWFAPTGALETSRERPDAEESAAQGACGGQEVHGDIALLLGEPARHTARAAAAFTAAFLPAPVFLGLLDQHPDLAGLWLAVLARRCIREQTRRPAVTNGTAEQRTVRLLLREARDGTVTASQTALAAMIGIRRPTLNRILKTLESDGLLDVHYGEVVLRKPRELQRRCVPG